MAVDVGKAYKSFNKKQKRKHTNTSRRVWEKRNKKPKGSSGRIDKYDIDRDSKGRTKRPKGGFKGSLKGVKTQDDFYEAQQKLVNKLYGIGATDHQVATQVSGLFDRFQAKKERAAAKRRNESNQFLKAGKWLDDKILDSNKVGRSLKKELSAGPFTGKHGFTDYREGKKIHDKVLKPTGHLLVDIIDNIERTNYGRLNALREGAKDTQEVRKSGSKSQDVFDKVTKYYNMVGGLNPVTDAINRLGLNPQYDLGTIFRSLDEGTAFKRGLNLEEKPTGYDVQKVLHPEWSKRQQITAGLTDDVLFDPANLVGVGFARGAYKGITGVAKLPKELLKSRKVTEVGNVRSAKYLGNLGIKSRAFRDTVTQERLDKLGIKRGEKLTEEHWKKILDVPLRKTTKTKTATARSLNEETQFYRDLETVVSRQGVDPSKEREFVEGFIRSRYGVKPNLTPIVQKTIDSALKAPKGSIVNRSGTAAQYLAENYPKVMENVRRIQFDNNLKSVAVAQPFEDGLGIIINPARLENEVRLWKEGVNTHVAHRHAKNEQDIYNGILVHELNHIIGTKLLDNAGVVRSSENMAALTSGIKAGDISERAKFNSDELFAEWGSAKHYGEKLPPHQLDQLYDALVGKSLIDGAPVETTVRGLRDALKERFKKDIGPIEKKIGMLGYRGKRITLNKILEYNPNLTRAEARDLKNQHNALVDQYIKDTDELKEAGRKTEDAIKSLKEHLKVDQVLDTIRKSEVPDRLGISLRVAGKDILSLRGSGKLAEQVYGMPMVKESVDLWRKMYENLESYSKRVHNPVLEIIRNKNLGGTSQVFQIYAKEYHKIFDGIKESDRKLELSNLYDKLDSGISPSKLTGRDKDIYDLFDSMVPAFKGELPMGNTHVTFGDITRYIPEQFAIDPKIQSIGSARSLMRALGSGVPKKIKELDQQIANTSDRKTLNQLKNQKKRLEKAVKSGVIGDPLQGVWAARIAVEEATGWVGLVEDIGRTMGIHRVVLDIKNPTKIDKLIEKQIEDGTLQTVKGIEGYAFYPEVAQDAKKLMELFDPKNMHWTLDFFDKATRAWKVSATLYNPGYYVRNMIGEITAGYFGGLKDPMYYERSGKVLSYIRDNSDLEQLLKSRTPVDDLLARPTSKYEGKAAFTKGGNKVDPPLAFALYHENNLTTNFVNTEFHEVGTHASGISKAGKMTGLPFLHNKLRSFGEAGENFPRMAHFLYALEQAPASLSVREAGQWAAEQVRKYHFDYSDITDFEKAVMMRVIPFYKWTRKAMPMVAETLLANPSKIALYPKLMNSLALSKNSSHDSEREGYTPTYSKDVAPFIQLMLAYPVGTDVQGNRTYLNINTPGFDALKSLFEIDATAQLMLNPGLKIPFEQLWGEKFNEQYDKDGLHGLQERAFEVADQVPLSKQAVDWWGPQYDDSNTSEPGALVDEDTFSYFAGITALEHKARKPFNADRNIENALTWGPYGAILSQITKAKDAGEDVPQEVWQAQRKFQYEHPELFPQYKGIRETINPDGTYVGGDRYGNLFNYHNPWKTPFGKYLRPDGSVDWDKINQDRVAGKLETETE